MEALLEQYFTGFMLICINVDAFHALKFLKNFVLINELSNYCSYSTSIIKHTSWDLDLREASVPHFIPWTYTFTAISILREEECS